MSFSLLSFVLFSHLLGCEGPFRLMTLQPGTVTTQNGPSQTCTIQFSERATLPKGHSGLTRRRGLLRRRQVKKLKPRQPPLTALARLRSGAPERADGQVPVRWQRTIEHVEMELRLGGKPNPWGQVAGGAGVCVEADGLLRAETAGAWSLVREDGARKGIGVSFFFFFSFGYPGHFPPCFGM